MQLLLLLWFLWMMTIIFLVYQTKEHISSFYNPPQWKTEDKENPQQQFHGHCHHHQPTLLSLVDPETNEYLIPSKQHSMYRKYQETLLPPPTLPFEDLQMAYSSTLSFTLTPEGPTPGTLTPEAPTPGTATPEPPVFGTFEPSRLCLEGEFFAVDFDTIGDGSVPNLF